MNKFLLDNPAAGFSRQFSSLKTLRQFIARNPALKATPYIWMDEAKKWQRFAIHGNQILPVDLLRSLLNSLQTSNTLQSLDSLESFEDCEVSPSHQVAKFGLN